MRLPLSRLTVALFRRRAGGSKPNPRRCRFARAALLWAPVGWVFLTVALWGAAETAAPVAIDPGYSRHIERVRATAAAKPDRPLALMLGSSRMMWSFQPEMATDDSLNWENVSQLGAGPVFNRLILHRLLRDGVRPSVIVIEIMPPYFVSEDSKWLGRNLLAQDLALVHRYWPNGELHFWYVEQRLLRVRDLARVWDPERGMPPQLRTGGGGVALPESVTPVERETRAAAQKRQHGANAADMRIAPGADRALRDTIREATGAGARVVLLRSPEGSVFRSWYHPERAVAFDTFMRTVAVEEGVPLIDARDWLTDDDFSDYHHALKRGAEKFTPRLTAEVSRALTDSR